jgi:hypothetical protein
MPKAKIPAVTMVLTASSQGFSWGTGGGEGFSDLWFKLSAIEFKLLRRIKLMRSLMF